MSNSIRLQPVTAPRAAAARHVRWLNDLQVVRYSENRHDVHTIDSQLTYLTTMGWPNVYREIWVGDDAVGTVGAYVDLPNSVANMGIMLGDKSCWGKGLGTVAWKAMMDYLFDRNVRKIEAGCMSANLPMLRIFQKSGMVEEGRRHGHFCLGARYYDEIYYSRFNASPASHTAPTVAGWANN